MAGQLEDAVAKRMVPWAAATVTLFERTSAAGQGGPPFGPDSRHRPGASGTASACSRSQLSAERCLEHPSCSGLSTAEPAGLQQLLPRSGFAASWPPCAQQGFPLSYPAHPLGGPSQAQVSALPPEAVHPVFAPHKAAMQDSTVLAYCVGCC